MEVIGVACHCFVDELGIPFSVCACSLVPLGRFEDVLLSE